MFHEKDERHSVNDFTAAKPSSYYDAIARFFCPLICKSWKFYCDFIENATQGAIAKPDYEPINYIMNIMCKKLMSSVTVVLSWGLQVEKLSKLRCLLTCRSVGANIVLSRYDCGGVDYVITSS